MTLPQATPNSDPAWFGFAVTLTPAAQTTRTDLLTYLDERKIGTRLLFGGNLTRQPYMLGRHYRCVGDLARTDEVMNHTFWFGVWPGLGEAQLDYVATALETYFGVNF
jgi:CDP-6-deoxy-D-xylo-4-hexulose-3-dehydrase